MDIALVMAPGLRKLEVYQSVGVRAPPLGLAYLAAVAEGEGHRVRIVDAPTLEMDAQEAAREALSRSPDVVGISSVTPTAYGAYRVARLVKERDPDVPVVMGGPHVSYMCEEALRNHADYVVVGEGERTFLELLRLIEGRIRDPGRVRGIAYVKDGRVVRTPPRPLIRDLDALPEPARHLLPMDRYTLFDKPIRIIHMMASRGCPYGCIYCVTSCFWGRRYRIRSPSLVADEVERAVERYRTNMVVFTDDELTLNRRWLRGFLRELRGRGLDLIWTCGSRVNSVDREILMELRKAGCMTIYYGIESHSDEDLRRIRKGVTIRQVEDAVKWTKRAGIEAAGSFILGFPWQRVEDIRRTVMFAKKLDLDYAQFTVATPYPGTPLYNLAKRLGLIEVWNWSLYTTIHPVMRGLYFTRQQLSALLSWAYRTFYLRPKFMVSQLLKGRIKTAIEIALKALKSRRR